MTQNAGMGEFDTRPALSIPDSRYRSYEAPRISEVDRLNIPLHTPSVAAFTVVSFCLINTSGFGLIDIKGRKPIAAISPTSISKQARLARELFFLLP